MTGEPTTSQTRPADADIVAARRWLRWPAYPLMVLAVLGMFVDVALAVHTVFNDAGEMLDTGGRERGYTIIAAAVTAFGFLMFIHLFVCYGAVQMLKVRTYSTARLASIIAILPGCTPVMYLGIPFGLWALILLCLPSIRAAFKANAEDDTIPGEQRA